MISILSAAQVRKADDFAINTVGIPEAVLMENAASFSCSVIKMKAGTGNEKNVLILCGAGNNGGDGFALGRLMMNEYDVDILFIGDSNKMSKSTSDNSNAFLNLNGNVIDYANNKKIDFNKYDIIVDALIGVGFNGDLRQNLKDILYQVNLSRSIKFALDIPTGMNADTGEFDENVFIADYTIAMFASKLGNYLSCRNISGEILVANLGLPNYYSKKFCDTFAIEYEDIDKIIPKRNPKSSKFDYGKVGILAGSEKYSGAAALCANAAIKAGAGLVHLFSVCRHSALLPEIIFESLSAEMGFIDTANYDFLIEQLSAMNSIIIGPGLGSMPFTLELTEKLIHTLPADIPILLDADALKAVKNIKSLRKNIILTPHIGEFANMTDKNRLNINPYTDCKEAAKRLNCTLLLKGNPTIISNGINTFINNTGNPGMATAGSGDVLSGIIGSLSAQSVQSLEAAAIGAFIHGYSGDIYCKKYNAAGLTASTLIENLKYIKY